MPPKSLMELAMMACIKNIRDVEHIGFLPYETVQEILFKIDSAAQLRQIEINSPHIEGQTGEIWLKIIEREFPLEYKANLYKPQDPKKWYRVWEKYKKEHDDALEESENKLKLALAGLRQDKEKNTSKIVGNKSLPTALRIGTKRHYGSSRDTSTSILNFGGGSRTKTSNGASIMRRVRREVKEIANIHGSLSRPIKAPSRPIGLKKAPEALLNDYRRAAQPVFRPTPKEELKLSALEEHEQRATFLSDSEEDVCNGYHDDEEEEGEDGETTKEYTEKNAKILGPSVKSQTMRPVVQATQKPPSSALQRKFGGSVNSPIKKSATNASSSVKRVPGILSNNPKPTRTKPQIIDSSSGSTPRSSSTKPSEQASDMSNISTLNQHRSGSIPPPESVSGPSSPQAVGKLSANDSEAQDAAKHVVVSRKRKAVSIFMQPKRRAM